MVIVPGAAGEIGVLARHAPLVAMLKAGEIRVKRGRRMAVLRRGPGLLQGAAGPCDRARGRRRARRGHRRRGGPPRGRGGRARSSSADAGEEEDRPLARRAAPPPRREQGRGRRTRTSRGLTPSAPSARRFGLGGGKAYAPGIYPRSEALVQATRDLDRGRTTPEAVDEQAQRDFQELVSVQEAAGLTSSPTGCSAGRTSSARSRRLPRVSMPGRSPASSTRTPSTAPSWSTASRVSATRCPAPIFPPEVARHAPVAARVRARRSRRGSRRRSLRTSSRRRSRPTRRRARPRRPQRPVPHPRGRVDELLAALGELPEGVRSRSSFRSATRPVLGALAEAPSRRSDRLLLDEPRRGAGGLPQRRSSPASSTPAARPSRPAEIARFVEALVASRAGIALTPNGDLQFVPEPIARQKLARLGQASAGLAEVA